MHEIISGLALIANRILGISYAPLPHTLDSLKLAFPLGEKGNFGTGVYTNNGGSYFVKIWRGYIPDLNYFNLLAESSTIGALASVYHSCYHLPCLRYTLRTPSLFALVYDYIDGISLDKFPLAFQKRKLRDLRAWINTLTLPPKVVPLQDKAYLIAALNQAYFQLILLMPLSLLSLFPVFSSIRRTLKFLSDGPYRLTHGDLTVDNVLIKGKLAYVLDWENAAYRPATYDDPDHKFKNYRLFVYASRLLNSSRRKQILKEIQNQ